MASYRRVYESVSRGMIWYELPGKEVCQSCGMTPGDEMWYDDECVLLVLREDRRVTSVAVSAKTGDIAILGRRVFLRKCHSGNGDGCPRRVVSRTMLAQCKACRES